MNDLYEYEYVFQVLKSDYFLCHFQVCTKDEMFSQQISAEIVWTRRKSGMQFVYFINTSRVLQIIKWRRQMANSSIQIKRIYNLDTRRDNHKIRTWLFVITQWYSWKHNQKFVTSLPDITTDHDLNKKKNISCLLVIYLITTVRVNITSCLCVTVL